MERKEAQRMFDPDTVLLVSATAEILLAVAATVLAWRVYVPTKTSEYTTHMSGLLSCINNINPNALSSEDNLRAIAELYAISGEDFSVPPRKRWAAFLARQVHQQAFFANKSGFLQGDMASRLNSQVLDRLLTRQDILSLLADRGFDSSFVRHCTLRATQLRDVPTKKHES